MERAETWDPEVKSIINDSDDFLVTARADLEAYWEGPAFDSFKVYVTHLESVIASTSDVTAEFSNLLQMSRETITKTYQEAVRFIGECAAIIVEATGGIIAGIAEFLLGVAEAVGDAIAAFIRNVTNLESTAMELMTEYGKLGLDLRQSVADLEIPSPLPSSAAEVENWNVRGRS
ncbi:MAG: hypothetical protein LC799_20890 [Actinobacteria bacterium]|nr:hypothetical protein [Actinomycetota bacterium]